MFALKVKGHWRVWYKTIVHLVSILFTARGQPKTRLCSLCNLFQFFVSCYSRRESISFSHQVFTAHKQLMYLVQIKVSEHCKLLSPNNLSLPDPPHCDNLYRFWPNMHHKRLTIEIIQSYIIYTWRWSVVVLLFFAVFYIFYEYLDTAHL